MISKQSTDTERMISPGRPWSVFPLHPAWLVLMTVVAGLAASGPLAGAMLSRWGYKKLGWLLGATLGFFGLLLLAFMFFWTVEWYRAALTLTGIHLFSGTALSFALRRPYHRFITERPVPPEEYGTYGQVMTGIAAGAFISGLLGIVCTASYTLLSDRLFSTLMPVAFEDAYAGFRVFTGVFFLILSGMIAGGVVGRFKPHIRPGEMILYGLALVWVYHTWLMGLECAIAVPGFQAGAATGGGWKAIVAPFFLGNFIIGFWWSVFLLFFVISPPGKGAKLGRAVQVVGVNISVGITFCIAFGYPADIFLASGRYFEREAFTTKALWCYERGLKKNPRDEVASYLQYRVALLNHRLGNRDKARQGFRRVVAKYTDNKPLVKKSNRFLDNLDRTVGKRRVVLPGVETRTEYKGGYCVPNSLALAMRYWGSDVTARTIGERITGLGSGTFIVNQRWFAEQEGFRHDFLPMADLDDIKRCIDAGFPVMVYVPSHVFAIVGYDEALETFVTYDVATRDVWVEYIQKDFVKAWKKQATTLVLAYPPEKEPLIPEDIRSRLDRLSDSYLHFQLHFFDAPSGTISVPHLLRAAGDTGEFFFPVTILHSDFPGLRKTVSQTYDAELVVDSIRKYFWDDFDEGIHLSGQRHNERWAWPDWALRFSIEYLTSLKRFDLIQELIDRIDDEGQVSRQMRADAGMIDLARGEFREGLDRLRRAGEAAKPLYLGLADLKMGNDQEAIRELVNAVKGRVLYLGMEHGNTVCRSPGRCSYHKKGFFADSKKRLSLDKYGFPEMAIANHTLVNIKDYGESREEIENNWGKWVHHIPFDAPIAAALARLYRLRIERLDKEEDAAAYQRLNRKLKIIRDRVSRYSAQSFSLRE